MELSTTLGMLSTMIFMLSQVPMMLKAIRTRSLYSYSLAQMLMNNGANFIHWGYISSLPFGPIWFLHSFTTLSTALMLFWYLRYEKRGSTNQTILSSEMFGKRIENGGDDKQRTESGKEMSDFHIYFKPYVDAIYRGALILTGNPREAEKLQVGIYLRAFMHFMETGPSANFTARLLELVDERFAEWKAENPNKVPDERKREQAMRMVSI